MTDQTPQRAGTPATLEDVARDAGVSLATASRVLNGSARRVAESYRERVHRSAAKLGYTPNLSAQAMALGGTKTLGLIVADIADPYFSSIAAGVIRAAEAAGLSVLMAATTNRLGRELELVRAMRGQRPRALIIAGSRREGDPEGEQLSAELAAYIGAGGRVVALSQPTLGVPTIEIDNRGGAAALARALIGIGYRRFGVAAGPAHLLTSDARLEGFRAELAAAGLPPARVARGEFTRDGGYAAAEELLAGDPRAEGLDAIFAVNDVMALGVMARLREAGLSLPGDVAVAGFDDIPTLRDISPALTTVAVPLEELGEAAVAWALEEADGSARRDGASAETRGAPAGAVVLRESTPARG